MLLPFVIAQRADTWGRQYRKPAGPVQIGAATVLNYRMQPNGVGQPPVRHARRCRGAFFTAAHRACSWPVATSAPKNRATRLRPQSATSFAVNVLALAVGLGVMWALAEWRDAPANPSVSYLPIVPCIAVFAVLALAEWLLRITGKLAPTEVARAAFRPIDLGRVGQRLLGLAATLGLVAFAYWVLPEYHNSLYHPYWQFLRALAPLTIVVPFYFVWVDARAHEPRDEFVHFGRLVLGRWSEADRAVIQRHLLGWTVKAFFLPLMTVYLNDEFNVLREAYRGGGFWAIPRHDVLLHLSIAIDLLFSVIGYTATTRVLDSHMRSVEPTLTGWIVALICYPPFSSLIGQSYVQYKGTTNWGGWLQPWALLYDCWGAVIVLFSMIYALSTVAFGLRFSNLTHRGIITDGPYRFTKHPAYLSKNLSWWLISVPFVAAQGWPMALRHCCLLTLLNAIYYLRALTEERHLSRDPVYVAYAEWINEHGLFSPLGRVLPWLRYRPPPGGTAGN